MIQKILHRLLRHRHFWRTASFSEVAELYAARVLRMMAINMTAAFTSIYLFQNGYSIMFIAAVWTTFFLYKALLSLPVAALVAYVGPKHGILWANLLFIPALAALALLDAFGGWVLIVMIVFQGLSTVLHQISYSVDFSKVKNLEHAGKEIAYMNMLEKLATGLSPLIGGLLAFVFGPEVVIIISAVLVGMAAFPLFKTAEPTLRRQRLEFRGFPWKLVTRTTIAELALGFDVFTSGTVWTLFTAIFIIGIESSNEIYAANGILMSVIFLAALVASYAYGRLIDHRRGKELMRYAAIANSVTHLMRPFTGSPIMIAGLNVANEAATAGYTMPYIRGIYDNADLSGHRTLYLGVMEGIANLGAASGAFLLFVLSMTTSTYLAMEYFFYVAAGVVLLVMTARFPLYRK